MSLTTYPQLHALATTLATNGLVKADNKYCGDRRPLSDTLSRLRVLRPGQRFCGRGSGACVECFGASGLESRGMDGAGGSGRT